MRLFKIHELAADGGRGPIYMTMIRKGEALPGTWVISVGGSGQGLLGLGSIGAFSNWNLERGTKGNSSPGQLSSNPFQKIGNRKF